jgi:hypothetical protein
MGRQKFSKTSLEEAEKLGRLGCPSFSVSTKSLNESRFEGARFQF